MGHATELLQSRGHRHVAEVAAHTLSTDNRSSEQKYI